MRRDMDLVRDLLLAIEADPEFNGQYRVGPEPGQIGITEENYDEAAYLLRMMVAEGFLAGDAAGYGMPYISGLSWKGHELLDAIRDPRIWKLTKDKAKEAGAGGVSILLGVAVEIAKGKLREMGLPIP